MSHDCGGDAGAGAAAPAAPQSSPEEHVEKLRQRGNDAFQRGNYSRASDLYKRVMYLYIVSATQPLGGMPLSE